MTTGAAVPGGPLMRGGRPSGVHGAGSRGLSVRQLPDVRFQGERHARLQAGADAVLLVTGLAQLEHKFL